MNDLLRLAELRSEVREPDAAALRAAEARFLAATRADRPIPRRAMPRRRPALAIAMPFAVGATVAITAVISASPLVPVTVPVTVPVFPVAAAEVLDRAAQAASQDTELSPRPDQFIVTESVSTVLVHNSGGSHLWTIPRMVWLPADGSRGGADSSPLTAITEEPGGQLPPEIAEELNNPRWEGQDVTCTPVLELPADGRYDYTRLTSLPTEPAAMLAVLESGPYGDPSSATRAISAARDLLRDAYLPPAQRAAVFHALGLVPQVSVVEGATDAVGRRGIAVAMVDPEWGTRSEIIFDAVTYRFLGERTVVVDPDRLGAANDGSDLEMPVLPAGTVTENSAQLSISLADTVPVCP